MSDVERVKNWLGKDLADLLTFEEAVVPGKGSYILLRPKEYLATDDFAKIAKKVNEHNGEYISYGKESHFRVAKEASKKFDNLRPLDVAVERLEENVRELKAKIRELRGRLATEK
jgi:hypothetical protein